MEMWEVLDSKGNPTGEVMKKNEPGFFERGLCHLGAEVWIINSDNKVLIQKRSIQKKLYPNVWAMTGGSVILGENAKDAIVREAKEELNIEIDANKLILITKIKLPSYSLFIEAYIIKQDYDIDKMKLQEEEVSDVKWATIEEIDNLVNTGNFIGDNRWSLVREIVKKEIVIE